MCAVEDCAHVCVRVCMCVLICRTNVCVRTCFLGGFFFLACDVHDSMTDAGMRVLVCAAVRKFKVGHMFVCALKAV